MTRLRAVVRGRTVASAFSFEEGPSALKKARLYLVARGFPSNLLATGCRVGVSRSPMPFNPGGAFPYPVAASAGRSGRNRRLPGRLEVARGRDKASSPQRRKRPPVLPRYGRGLRAPCEVRPYFVTASEGQRGGPRRMSRRRDVVAGFGILPPDGGSRVLCRRRSRPIRDYLPTVRRTEVVGERAGHLAAHPAVSSPVHRRRCGRPTRGFPPNLSGGRARAPCPVARRARLRTASGGREDPPAVRGAAGRDWGAPGPRPLNPEKARPFFVATAAGRRKGSVECPRDGIWRDGEPGSIPSSPQPSSPQPRASARGPAGSPGGGLHSDGWPESASLSLREPRPYLCAAAAGRSERHRRTSGR